MKQLKFFGQCIRTWSSIFILINLTQFAIGQFGHTFVMNSENFIPAVVFIVLVIFVKMSDVKHIWDKSKTNLRKIILTYLLNHP